jgi:hypothetical protein
LLSVTAGSGGAAVGVARGTEAAVRAGLLVLADQQVAEYGMHDELVTAGNLYAELYDLQARSYRA